MGMLPTRKVGGPKRIATDANNGDVDGLLLPGAIRAPLPPSRAQNQSRN